MTGPTPRRDARPLISLPLPAGTALCLACSWMNEGPDALAAACAHTRETSHPTAASPLPPPAQPNGGPIVDPQRGQEGTKA